MLICLSVCGHKKYERNYVTAVAAVAPGKGVEKKNDGLSMTDDLT